MTEDAFLQTLRDRPDDEVTRRVYADWLDEQDDPACRAKAEYIRTDLELATKPKRKAERDRLADQRSRLSQKLGLDWMATVSLAELEACRFKFQCPLKWESLKPVEGEVAVRYCEQCQENVHYCGTIKEAQRHAWVGHCVAVDVRVARKNGDLDPPMMLMGLISPSRRDEDDTD